MKRRKASRGPYRGIHQLHHIGSGPDAGLLQGQGRLPYKCQSCMLHCPGSEPSTDTLSAGARTSSEHVYPYLPAVHERPQPCIVPLWLHATGRLPCMCAEDGARRAVRRVGGGAPGHTWLQAGEAGKTSFLHAPCGRPLRVYAAAARFVLLLYSWARGHCLAFP